MTQQTSIEWTDLTWNPVHGCSKVSPGCAHCYAETLSRRYKHTRLPWTPANAAENVILKPHKLREPLGKGKDWQGLGAAAAAAGKTDGKLVFVNSTSDLFHELIPPEFVVEVFAVMALAARHDFQVLTKRPEVMHRLLSDNAFWLDVADAVNERGDEQLARQIAMAAAEGNDPAGIHLLNVWLGVSIENRRFIERADILRETSAAVRFISAEPLLGPLVHSDGFWDDDYTGDSLDLWNIDWLIVGGESGPDHRPMREEWARRLHWAAQARHVPFLMKQMGGARPGDQLEDLPEDLRVREFPQVHRVPA